MTVNRRVTVYQFLIGCQTMGIGAILYQALRFGDTLVHGHEDLVFITAYLAIYGGLLVTGVASAKLLHGIHETTEDAEVEAA